MSLLFFNEGQLITDKNAKPVQDKLNKLNQFSRSTAAPPHQVISSHPAAAEGKNPPPFKNRKCGLNVFSINAKILKHR